MRIKLLLKNANTIMFTASTDGFKQNWWSDKHEYHLGAIVWYTTEDSLMLGDATKCGRRIRSLKT